MYNVSCVICSLCNTQATSKQTLLLHAEGKKHKGKARGFHAAKKQSNQTEESVPDKEPTVDETPKFEVAENGHNGSEKQQDQLDAKSELGNLGVENGTSPSKKKRKRGVAEDDTTEKTRGDDPSRGNGEVIQAIEAEIKPIKDDVRVSKSSKEDSKKKIKWKKLITSILKSVCFCAILSFAYFLSFLFWSMIICFTRFLTIQVFLKIFLWWEME